MLALAFFVFMTIVTVDGCIRHSVEGAIAPLGGFKVAAAPAGLPMEELIGSEPVAENAIAAAPVPVAPPATEPGKGRPRPPKPPSPNPKPPAKGRGRKTKISDLIKEEIGRA